MKLLRALALCALVACGPSSSAPDAGTGTDGSGSTVDAFGGPDFGEQCTTSADCEPDGYCVDGQNSDICTYDCDAGCPEGWNCRITDVAGELVSLCLPQKFDFCKPCSADVQCNGGICVQLDNAGYCLPQCPFEGQCPTGYSCGADPSGTHSGNYCVPQTGSCTCTADQAGQVRSCQTTNAAGTCYGLETCNPNGGGWGACTAPTASMEVCDGLDNDCDQLIDDGVSGSACANTIPNVGSCPGVQLCTGTTLVCQGKTPMLETCNYSDDDCDTMVDEAYPNLAQVCSAGIGGCERFGVYRCTTAGTGTECSVVAGSPMTELCNGLDDDCDNSIDEPFTTLGQSCSVGVGACARQGNLVCNGAGTGTQCSVTAGTGTSETCNGIDDDCDTKTDEGYLNQTTNQYDQNTACGSCATDCTVLYALPNASGVCNATGTPTCAMVCAPNSFNLDGAVANGCELVLDPGAIYVSINDPQGADDASCGLGPVGTGAGNHPCLTIAQGINRANVTGRLRVRVANGIYAEAVTIADGKSLLGGHRPDNWQRDVAGTGTLITGVATIAATNHDYAVRAIGITATTLFEGFVVIGPLNAKVGGNAYTIYVSGASASLSIQNNVLYGGRGGPGASGTAGLPGAGGADGIGRDSNPTGYDAKVTTGTAPCDPVNNRAFANGGVRSCGSDNVSGGNGGGNRCAPRPSKTLDQMSELSALDGIMGQVGDPLLGGNGGNGADAGDDMVLLRQTGPFGGDLCALPPNPDYGKDGELGRDALHGTAGPGCSAPIGSVVNGHWSGGVGGVGITGGNGGGGGGGGGGAGSYCAANGEFSGYNGCADGRDRLGGHGGGGGSGGCGGTGGGGATAGGGAFTIFIVGGTAPIVTGNSLVRGEGGTGGTGGTGGSGGAGGFGAPGGTSALFCAGSAGRGGNGGDGGHGAGGGGGCGGGSFGVFTSGIGTPNYCQAVANNSISSGVGGAGGPGGYSLINTGGAGSVGVLATCQFN